VLPAVTTIPVTTQNDRPPIGVNPDGSNPLVGPEIINNHLADRAAFAANTIHFDYDKAIVKASEVGKLQPVIAALKASPQNKLLIEGHCDERGTEEYNRALGERRALAIRAHLIKAGKLAPDRIITQSFGEDKPIALGHDEAAWAKNRRGELVLLKPKN
jgi:peptidoglycan-associated lipoprotein